MKIEDLTQYEIIEKREISDLKSMSYLLKHKKTGARIALLENDDENKVFTIGFRTPPTDSTGVPHILEHSVLCGSKEFPLKDPFVELAKGSLNTFLNAMTYPDKTVYPVASCNDKDFQNLIHVYLDAVFHPNIYNQENIFRQEGWHYELENPEDELAINGVVYNEMKGAFSSPDDVLWREVSSSLFPDTTYGTESGGDPEYIPDLTYQQFLEFHGRYYHPSNSYIYLYGNMDMAEKLQFMDEYYLSEYDALSIDSEVATQTAFEKPIEKTLSYPITEGESEKDNSYLSYNMVVGNSLNPELYVAMDILDYALCTTPGAPLKQALIDKGIGKDVYSMCESSIKQPVFCIVAKNANEDQKEEFVQTILQVLKEQRKKGIDRKALLAGINYYEFKYREADFGSYPKGLMYGLQMFDSWLYDESKPFIHVEANETYAALKAKVETGYFEQLIEDYLINNNHKSVVIIKPEKGLTAKKDKALQDKLSAYKKTLSNDEIQNIIDATIKLEEYQEEEETKEALESIPLLTRDDMKKEAEPFVNEIKKVDETTLLFHNIFTNQIGYLRLVFNLKNIPEELITYLGILKTVLGYIDTTKHTYGDLNNEINIQTGGISTTMNTYTNSKNLSEYEYKFEIKAKALYSNISKAFELAEEIMLESRLEDTKRLYEIIAETKSRMQGDFMSSGHSLAAIRALSYISPLAAIAEQTSGIVFYRLIEDLDENFETKKELLTENLKKLVKMIFRPENLMVDYTADNEGLDNLENLIRSLRNKLITEDVEKKTYIPVVEKRNEGFTSSSQIQYVCRAGNFVNKGLLYTGALRVLKVIMGYDYLWSNVRVKGGAYGCMNSFGKSGDCYFVSYRDPNLEKTIEIYEAAATYVSEFNADEREITKFIIGAISELDVPMNPATKGTRSLAAYLANVTLEDIQKEREELLTVTVEKIRELHAYIEAFMEDECLCVVGNEEKIQEQSSIFMNVEGLFH